MTELLAQLTGGTFMFTLITGAIVFATPYALAAMGGYTSERSGVMNIALEGKMLMSACVTAIVALPTHNALLGVLAGMGSAILLSLFHWLLTQHFQIDQIISGMAINAISFGATNFLAGKFIDQANNQIPILPLWKNPFGQNQPFQITIFMLLAFLLPVLLAYYAARSRGGLRMMAVGSDPEKARLIGVQPRRVRLVALIAAGAFTGLAGAMIVSNAGSFTDNMTAGRGFIALAALIVGGWRPIPSLLACLAFGVFDALQLQLQGTALFGVIVPSPVWQSVPYVVTVIALAGFLGRSRPPAGLGKA